MAARALAEFGPSASEALPGVRLRNKAQTVVMR